MHLQWIPNAAANALHIADCSLRFPDLFVDANLGQTFLEGAEDLDQLLRRLSPDSSHPLWQSLISSTLVEVSGTAIANHAFQKRLGAGLTEAAPVCGSKITELIALFNRSLPRFAEQIEFRTRPLQDQWLGFGNGLIKHIGRLTACEAIPEQVRVVPYHPVLNGFCESFIPENAIGLEAVLTNPIPELPEVLRMAWGIAQLNLELPLFSEAIDRNTLSRVAPLVMLPPVLAAAQVMELSQCSNAVAEIAIEHWHIPVPKDRDIHTDIVPTLMSWWETFLQSKPSLHIGIQALAKMLDE